MLSAFFSFLSIAAAWNLNWSRQTNLGHADSRENKRPEQRVEALAVFFDKLNEFSALTGPCETCTYTLSSLKASLLEERGTLAGLFHGICGDRAPIGGMFEMFCANMHWYESDPAKMGFSFFPDFANASTELDPLGIDGEYSCHYMFSNACPRPQTPEFEYDALWPAKPEIPDEKPARSNETFRVLHVSDVHLSANYTEGAPANCMGAMCCEQVSVQSPFEQSLAAPKFGHWRCDCPQALLDSTIRNSAKHSSYEFASFTGDMVDHNPVFITQEETFKEEISTMRSLKRYLGDIRVFPVLGNHDSYPYSQEPAVDSSYANRTHSNIELMQHMWSSYGWIDDDAANEVELTHGGYTVEPVKGLKVITSNSNYWYRWNFYNYINMSNPDPSGMLQFLIDELVDCEERGLKAWIQAHVPPGGSADEALPPAASLSRAILERFDHVITGQFFGHTHLDEFTVLYDNNATVRSEETALNVAWVAPSITPYTNLNPGFRYYEVDKNTFEIMDAITMYADIEPGFGSSWPETPDLDWKWLYSAREKYGKDLAWPRDEPLNGKFWHRVAKESSYNPGFAKEFVIRSYRSSSQAPICTDYECRAERFCYSTSMTPDQVAQCHEEFRAGSRSRPGAARKKYHQRKYGNRPGIFGLSPGGHSFKGVPQFPMPRPARYLGV